MDDVDQSSNESAGVNLPPPVNEQALPPYPANENVSKAPEATQLPSEKISSVAQSAPTFVPPLTLPPAGTPTISNTQTDVSKTTPSSTPILADDGDLIEKEWVNKAKKIVEDTREDPNLQSKELNVFKADYMKKRYNKTIKLSE